MFDATTAQLHALSEGKAIRSTLDALASLPEEEVWLASRKSRETRQAYAGDVRCFMRLFGITSPEALRQVDRKVIMAYERHLREVQRLRAYLGRSWAWAAPGWPVVSATELEWVGAGQAPAATS